MAKALPDTVMTIEELSKYLKISRSTLYKLACRLSVESGPPIISS